MALQADFALASGCQARGVDDGSPDLRPLPVPRCLNVRAARAVTSLAVDAFWQCRRKYSLTVRRFRPGWHVRVSVVAEHAIVFDVPVEAFLIRPVVPRVHGPI